MPPKLRPASNKKAKTTGKIQSASQGQMPTPKRPFNAHEGVNQEVIRQQGMTATTSRDESSKDKGVFINFDDLSDQLGDMNYGGDGNMAQVITSAVEAAIKTAIPAIVQAVRDAFMVNVKESVNPVILRSQFRMDEMEQETKRENLRISGLAENGEEEEGEESEDDLIRKVIGLAKAVDVEIQPSDISSCYRIGKWSPDKEKIRQSVVRFTTRRRRDALYQARFGLKDKDNFTRVYMYVNEDLTRLRYSVMMAAKKIDGVKSVATRSGTIVCKMDDGDFKTIRNPDDLFDLGLDDMDYARFKLFVIA